MSDIDNLDYWRKCSTCKSPIGFQQKYWVCSVSTCNRTRTSLAFCKVSCFDAHVPVLNHKNSGAIEKRSPSSSEWNKQLESEKPVIQSQASSGEVKLETLVVVSKVKDYIKAKAGLNTSEAVIEILSDKIRSILDDAIRRAIQDERKTLLDRDFR